MSTRSPWSARGERAERAARASRRIAALRLPPAVLAATTLAVGLFAGTAYAYFAVTGSGTGKASVGHLQPIEVEHATATVTSPLFPGGTGTLALTLTNPNPFTVTVVGVSQDGPVTVTTASGRGSGCTSDTGTWPSVTRGTSGVTVSASVATGLDLPIALGPSGASTVTVANGAAMATSSDTTCQGASFHIPVTVTVHT